MPVNYGQALDELAEEITDVAELKGFWDLDATDLSIIPLKLALVHDEVSEALRVHREIYDDSPQDPLTLMTDWQETEFTEELADILIRVLDLAGFLDLDIGTAVVEKIEKNKARPKRHGKRY